MIKRSTALCDGKIIGIETIFDVKEGEQINKEPELSLLRGKSRNWELFCPCECGQNLILVAGEKNLRNQHFRLRKDAEGKECHYLSEGETSVESKIVIKSWIEDKLHPADIESRVPICSISDSNRKYELSFLSKELKHAIDYCYDYTNISDEKLSDLDENANGIKIIHIVDTKNGGCNGQYPESLMKIQKRQGYCLLLEISDIEYSKALLSVVYYDTDIDGLWKEVEVSNGFLKDYTFVNGELTYLQKTVENLMANAKKTFEDEQLREKTEREEKERKWLEAIKEREARLEEEKRKREALLKEQEEQRLKKEKEDKEAESKRIEQENLNYKNATEYINGLNIDFESTKEPLYDEYGKRWLICKICKKIDREDKFHIRGGDGITRSINVGICSKVCQRENQKILFEQSKLSKRVQI